MRSESSIALHIKLPDEAATLALGSALAAGAVPGRVLHLRGDLGAGKTTVVRGLLRGLGYAGRVKSPTYTLVEPYCISSLNFYHFDFYRFKDESEWLSSGFREYFGPGSVCVVEWPERAGGLLAPPDLQVRLVMLADGREAKLQPLSAAGEAWLSSARSRLASM
jgi:tRNA threonylcarbamoyladenosine biosynthesis protein TsaE